MFARKTESLTKRGGVERLYIREGSSLTRKHKTKLERLAKDKPFSLFGPFGDYACKGLFYLM
jgi:hypothetical protein